MVGDSVHFSLNFRCFLQKFNYLLGMVFIALLGIVFIARERGLGLSVYLFYWPAEQKEKH